jgi:hypothetical protein
MYLRLDELCSVGTLGTHQNFKNLDSYNGGTDSPKISEISSGLVKLNCYKYPCYKDLWFFNITAIGQTKSNFT